MPIQAGFAEADITPPVGTEKIGWLKKIVSEQVLDPLHARVAVFESGVGRVAFIQLDLLSVRRTQVNDIRNQVAAAHGFPPMAILVAATHNHAGPAVAGVGEATRDEAYIREMVSRVVAAFGHALRNRQEADVGFGSCFDFAVAHNRRVVMRDGTVRTHGTFETPDALFLEGPIDPEVAVFAARLKDGQWLGAIVNYACHPTHEGGGTGLSGGYPGVLSRALKEKGCPVALFLNGACGNLHTADPCCNGAGMSMQQAGERLAEDAAGVMAGMTFRHTMKLHSVSRTIQLPYRRYTEEEVKGTIRGAQRFIDPAIYDRGMSQLLERIRARGTQPAEVQVISMDEIAWVAIPAEYFVEHGLRIKEECYPRRALISSCANGMVGYVPTRAAFMRGGYETTFAMSSRLAPEAGDLLADAAIELVKAS